MTLVAPTVQGEFSALFSLNDNKYAMHECCNTFRIKPLHKTDSAKSRLLVTKFADPLEQNPKGYFLKGWGV